MRIALNTQILFCAIMGISFGLFLFVQQPDSGFVKQSIYLCGLIGNLFVDLLKMVLAPLVFTSITVGVANLRKHSRMQIVWKSTLFFFGLSMAIAVMVALGAANLFEPGGSAGRHLFNAATTGDVVKQLTLQDFIADFLHGLFMNPFTALAQGNVLPIVVFALLLGIALVIGGERYRNILLLMQEGLEIILLMVSWIMRLAPLGIMALLAKLLATQNPSIFTDLLQFIGVVLGATLVHGFILLPLLLFLFTGMTPGRFFRGAREAMLTAFATSSSSAALPVSMRCVEQHLHVKPGIAGFVLPLGATMNMDGTALYEALAALFIANLAGIDLDLLHKLILFFTTMVAAMGAPGIPSAGMVTMVMVLQATGLPTEAIALLLPVDRLLDTVRTMVNVEGDMVGALVVQTLVEKNTVSKE